MIVFSLIIILAVAYAFYFFLGKNKNATEIQSTGLTNEQRTTIIKELDSGEKTDSIAASIWSLLCGSACCCPAVVGSVGAL